MIQASEFADRLPGLLSTPALRRILTGLRHQLLVQGPPPGYSTEAFETAVCGNIAAVETELTRRDRAKHGERTMSPSEQIVVTFESDLHRDLHLVLMHYGFTFEVRHDLLVGRNYRHSSKPISVSIKDGDPDLETYTEVNGEVQASDNFSEKEWKWMSEVNDLEPEFLRRQLHILLRERPHYLTGTPPVLTP